MDEVKEVDETSVDVEEVATDMTEPDKAAVTMLEALEVADEGTADTGTTALELGPLAEADNETSCASPSV